MLGLAVGVVSMGLMARYLGQEQFGWYVISFTWLQFFSIAVDFGLYLVGLKMLGEVSEVEEKSIFSQIWWLRLFSAIVLVLLLPNIIWLMPYVISIKIGVSVLAVSFFLANLNQLLTVSFQKTVHMQVVATAEILGKIATLGVLYLVIILNLGFIWVLATASVYAGLQFVILFWKKSKQHNIIWVWDRDIIKKILIQAWPLGVIILLNTIYFKADTIMLSWFVPASDVGLYGAAYKVLEILVSFPAMYLGLLLPFISKWWSEKDLSTLHSYVQQSLVIMSALAFPMVAVFLVFASDIIVLIAGFDFADAGYWLQILSLAAGSIFFGQLFGYILVGVGKQKLQMKIYALTTTIALVLYSLFIPRFGVQAAAITTVGVELFAMAVMGMMAIKIIKWKVQIKPVLLFALLSVVVYSIMSLAGQFVPWWLAIVFGGVVYTTLVYFLKLIRIEHIKSLFSF